MSGMSLVKNHNFGWSLHATAGRRQAFAEAQALAALEDAKARWQFSQPPVVSQTRLHQGSPWALMKIHGCWSMVNMIHG